jgi:hypothetical protein
LTDVTTTSPESGEFLKYNGTNWVNADVGALTNGNLSVTLNTDGSMTFPSNRIDGGTNTLSLFSSNQASLVWRGAGGAGLPLQSVVQARSGLVNIGTATGILGGATVEKNWQFDTSGNITFPDSSVQSTAWTGTYSYTNLTDKPTLFSGAYADLSGKPTLFSGNYTDLTNKPTLFSGNYTDLTNKPTLFSGAGSALTGTSLADSIVSSSLTSVGTLTSATVDYQPGTTTGAAITASAKNSQGGTGFGDFLKATNTSTGTSNGSKWFRINNIGTLEVVNNAYTATLLSLSDIGNLSVSGDYQVNGKKAVNGPAFSVYRNSAATIPTDVLTLMAWTTEEYDTADCMTSTRFTPNVEGYYSLVASVRFDGDIGTGERMISIKKNGNEYRRGMNAKGTASVGTSWFQMEVSCQVYANGSTDYFEVWVHHGAGADRNTTAGQVFTAFQGCMLRGA